MAPDIRLVKEHQHEQKEECDEDQEEDPPHRPLPENDFYRSHLGVCIRNRMRLDRSSLGKIPLW